jgi:hypothetical protein
VTSASSIIFFSDLWCSQKTYWQSNHRPPSQLRSTFSSRYLPKNLQGSDDHNETLTLSGHGH